MRIAALSMFGLTEQSRILAPEIQAFIGQTEGLRDQFSAVMGAAGWTDESIGAAGFASLAEAETEAVRRSLEGWLETVALTHDGAAALAEAFGDIPGVLDMLTAEVEDSARALEDAWTDREHAATGQGYLTTLDALATDYEAGLAAAAETGADASALARAVTAEIAAAVSGLDASALAGLIDRFRDVGIVATGLSQALHDLEASAARARDAAVAQERATLDASLWRLTGNTAAIRAAEIAAATPENRDMVRYLHQVQDLLAAHGEAATIAREAAEAQVDAAREAYAAWRETDAARREALAEAVATWADLARVADGVGADLRRWLDGLDTGAASTLAPRARMDAAEADFARQLALTQSDDDEVARAAYESLTAHAEAWRAAAREYHGSTAGYFEVEATLRALLEPLADALGHGDTVAGQDEMLALLTAIGDNTGLAGPLAKQVPLASVLTDVFGGLGEGSYLGRLAVAQAEHTAALEAQTAYLHAADQHEASLLAAIEAAVRALDGLGGSGGGSTPPLPPPPDPPAPQEPPAPTRYYDYNALMAHNAPMAVHKRAQDYMSRNADVLAAWRAGTLRFGDGTLENTALGHFMYHGQHEGRWFSAGGWVNGPGGPTDDAIDARLSAGEFVLAAGAATYIANAAPGLIEALNDNQVHIAPLSSAPDLPAPNVIPFAPPMARDDGVLIDRVERLESRLDTLIAAVHGEASAGRRTDGGLTQSLIDELRALRRDLGAQTGRADLAARAAVGGRRA